MGKRVQISPKKEQSFIPSDGGDLTEEAEVLAIGEDCTFLKVGDTVLYKSWAVDSVDIADERFYFIKETDDVILAKCGKTQNVLTDTSTTIALDDKPRKQSRKSVGGAKTASSSK